MNLLKKLLITSVFLSWIGCIDAMAQEKAYLEEIRVYRESENDDFKNPDKSPLSKKERKAFEEHDFYPVDEKLRVMASLQRTPESKPFQMATSDGGQRLYRKYGDLIFDLNGKGYSLEIYQQVPRFGSTGNQDLLFLPFKDLTNGKETYEAGRYLHYESAPEGNEMIIDFNKAYNPYCAYSDRYSCPLAPEANHLDTEIKAGVKAYKKY